jgi:uncharacterized protein (DUF983 family)
MLGRAWRLRCPRCGQGELFNGPFSMLARCPDCRLRYEREPGYFLGSIYVNYGITALLVTLAYFALFFSDTVTPQNALWIVAALALVFPIWFFRYARSLWLAFDHYWDPTDPKQDEPAEEAESWEKDDEQREPWN